MKTILRNTLLAGLLMLASGCDYLPFGFISIRDITTNPMSFEGKEVKIAGTVTDVVKIPVLEIRVFIVSDGTGQIAVATNGIVPGLQQKVAVRGLVESTAIIGGQSLGLHVTERKRLPRY